MPRARRRSRDDMPRRPVRTAAADESAAPPEQSPTAVAAEALRTGVSPPSVRTRVEIPGEDEKIQVGDPDDKTLANEYVGDETPGGSSPTPDQSNVDDIGRAYGLQEEDEGAVLRSSAEVLARRDHHRSELRAPRKPTA